MTRLKTTLCALLVILAAGALAYPVFAHCGKCAADGKKIAAHLDQNKTTLAKAVTAAEAHSKGRAISIISQLDDKGQVGVHVFCMAADKIQKCQFDGATGTIISMKEVKEFPIVEDDHAGHDHGTSPAAGGGGGSGGASGGASAKLITDKTVEAGCGSCIYAMTGVKACHLAVMIDGKPFLVEGATWPNHDFCDRKVQAVVTGKVEGDKFIATSVKEKS